MARGVIATCIVLLAMFIAPDSTALAASDLHFQRAADGTLLVVGSGWRPANGLVVSVGQERFTAWVDGTGDFEVATGLVATQGELAVHHLTRLELPPRPPGPQPLALLLARGIAQGASLLGALVGLSLVVLGTQRWMRRA